MESNPARAALTNAVNKAIAEGAPVYENVPAIRDYLRPYCKAHARFLTDCAPDCANRKEAR